MNEIAFYNILFDRDRDKIIHAFEQVVITNPEAFKEFKGLLESEGITPDVLQNLMEEISDKSHELGWCDDPDCKWKKKDK